MKVLHLAGGGDVGGAKSHIISLVKELSKYIDVKIISFRPGAFAEDARAMGIDVEVVNTGSIFRDIKRVLDIIKKGGYQIVHSHGAKANMISVLTHIRAKTPTVTTVHSDYRLDYLHSIYKNFTFGLINKIALRFINYYIAVSGDFKKMLVSRGFDSRRIFTVYNGISFNLQYPNVSRQDLNIKYGLNLSDTDVVVNITARLHPVKSLDIYIKAANEVLKHNKSVKFLICGEGEERKKLEQQIESLGLTDRVFLLGHVNNPFEIYTNIDINVLTSMSESFPYVILEGATVKRATISSNVGGIADLIEDGVNGFLFTPGDYMRLAECILKLADDSDLRVKMGELIYEKAKTYFSIENMCRTHLDIYSCILKAGFTPYGKNSRYDVMLSGYYGFKNSGDDAILAAIINNLNMYKPDIKMLILSANPRQTQAEHGVDSINRYNIFKIINAMKKTRLFIYGGGNLLQDDTSTRSLMYYLGTTWLAKKFGLKIMFYAAGIGPISKKTNRKLTQKIINKVDVITLREELSARELDMLLINKPKILLAADPVLTIKPVVKSNIDSILRKEKIPPDRPFIGISIRRWGSSSGYISVIAQAADYAYEQYGLTPVFIPMQHPDDLYVISSVMANMKSKAHVIRNEYNISDVFGIINRMEMLIGMRLHSLIYAASLGVPIVGIAYEPKVEGFLQSIDILEASAGDINMLSFDTVKETMDYVWNNRENIRQHLHDVMPLLKQEAYKSAKVAIELLEKAPC